jgi:hypothetical protein
MPIVSITHEWNEGWMRRFESRNGAVMADLIKRGYRVEAQAKRLCPVDQGRLRASIHVVPIMEAGRPAVLIGTDVHYARWVHEGTGFYGPRHDWIYPRRARYLVFTPRKAQGRFIPRRGRVTVFAKRTRGMHGTPFLHRALVAAR